MMAAICQVQHLGILPYQQAWDLQNHLADEIARGERPATLLLLQHPHTYTFGRRGDPAHLLWDAVELERRGVCVHWVDRGGDVTYHGPGQLVGYPLLPLGSLHQPAGQSEPVDRLPRADYVGYLRKLEITLIEAVAELGVTAHTMRGLTGVWARPHRWQNGPQNEPLPAKLAAIGVKVDARGVSRHGFALNIDPDMRYWRGIIGCGLAGYHETSLAELLGQAPSFAAVSQAVLAAFGQVFEYEILDG